MGLRESEQQDANEFYRLFVSMLEASVDRDISDRHVERNFIRDLLGGIYSHITECKNCRKKSPRNELFTQIELNIKACWFQPVFHPLA